MADMSKSVYALGGGIVCDACERVYAVDLDECPHCIVSNREATFLKFLGSRRNATYAEMCAALHDEGIMYDTVSQLIERLTARGEIEKDGEVFEHDGFIDAWRVVPTTTK